MGRPNKILPWKPEWEKTLAVKPSVRCEKSGEVVCIVCQFCVYFGPGDDEPTDKPRLRKQTTICQTWRKGKWRVDSIKRHHNRKHAKLWDEYQKCSAISRASFFQHASKVNVKLTSFYSQKNTEKAQHFYVKQNIGDVLVKEVICDAGNKDSDFSVGDFFEVDGNSNHFLVRVEKDSTFQICIHLVSLGLSFRQIEAVMAAFYKQTEDARYKSLSRLEVSKYTKKIVHLDFKQYQMSLDACGHLALQ